MRILILGSVAALLLIADGAPAQSTDSSARTASSLSEKEFVRRVVGDTEDVWTTIFQTMQSKYEPPKVVLFTDSTASGCGIMKAAAGPSYCAPDRKVYLDPAFLSQLFERSGADAEFARAFLVVHEISHHIPGVLGNVRPSDAVAEQQRDSLQIRRELQADCYTGVWAFFVQRRNLLEPGELEQVPAAQMLGDSTKYGTAAQRLWWFKQGLATGDP